MELHELFEGLSYEVLQYGRKPVDITGVTIDSRSAVEGCVFVCLAGTKSDGHDFIDQAAQKGAAAVVCQKRDVSLPSGVTVILVNNTRKALNVIAANYYGNPAGRMRIIGVTGTKGKTSVTYFLEKIITECGYTAGVIGTTGARAGGESIDIPYATSTTPDTIELQMIFAEMAKRGTNYVVMEVSSHALELNKVDGVDFAVGIFTNLTHDHLDFHGNMENYLKAKAKLFDFCRVGVVNGDDKSSEFIVDYAGGKIPFVSFGMDGTGLDYRAKGVKLGSDGVRFGVYIGGEDVVFDLAVPGRFSVMNALSAIVAAVVLKMPQEGIIKGVSAITTVPGRVQKVANNKGFSVIVDYAHTPDSLKQIIETVREFTEGRVITVFGCGGDRDPFKRPVMGEIAARLSDVCVITSDNPRNEKPGEIIRQVAVGAVGEAEVIKITDRREAIKYAVRRARAKDAVIIAGKGHEDYQEFEDKRKEYFDDVKEAEKALEET